MQGDPRCRAGRCSRPAAAKGSHKPPPLLQTSLEGGNYPRNDAAPCSPNQLLTKDAVRRLGASDSREEPCLRGGLGTAGSP